MLRTRNRSTKLSTTQVSSQLPGAEPDAEFNPDEHSYLYSPSRQRQTRGELMALYCTVCLSPVVSLTLCSPRVSAHRVVSPGPSEEAAAPVTRSKMRVKDIDVKVSFSVGNKFVHIKTAAEITHLCV